MATTFTNQATLTLDGAAITSNIAVGQIEDVLSVTKDALTSDYSAGDEIVYSVSIRNTGVSDLDALTLTDDLGAYTFGTGTITPLDYVDGSIAVYINGVLQPDPAVSTENGLTVGGINIPAGGNAVIIYKTQLNTFAPLQTASTITNTVTVSGAGQNPASAQEIITATNAPQVSMTKSISPVPVAANGEVTYTFVMQNTGNTAVLDTDNAVISDTFDPLLSNLSVTLNGTALQPTTGYTYDAATGEFSTVQGVLGIPAATFTQDPDTGEWSVAPGTSTLVVSGTITQ